jgi:hypothetical protein
MKKELEEAAEEFYSEQSKAYEDKIEPMFDTSRYLVAGFIEGANYQAERMYSQEDMRKAYDQGIDDSFDIGFSSKDDTNFNAFIEQFKKK